MTEVKTGTIYQVEEYAGMHPKTEVQSKNMMAKMIKNITSRTNRGTGIIITQIMTKLEDIYFGKYYSKVAVIW